MGFGEFVLSVVVPAVVALVGTYLLNKKYEKERRKRTILSDFMAYRNAISQEGGTDFENVNFFPVMNRIIIEFDDENLNSLLRQFQKTEVGKRDPLLFEIIETMIKKAGIKNLKRSDELIKHPFRHN